MKRGDRRDAIFADEADRLRFLETLSEACGKPINRFTPGSFSSGVGNAAGQPGRGQRWFLGTGTARFKDAPRPGLLPERPDAAQFF
jgi:hypothetical protein